MKRSMVAVALLCTSVLGLRIELGGKGHFGSVDSREYMLSLFQNYREEFNKHYTADEFEHRFENFIASHVRVKSLRSRYPSGANYGFTKYSDLSVEEFKNFYLMKEIKSGHVSTAQKTGNVKVSSASNRNGPAGSVRTDLRRASLEEYRSKRTQVFANATVPSSFDWRNNSVYAVTPVKNQEQCGSCWAFSATEAIESAWLLAQKPVPDNNISGFALAPQQLVDCDDLSLGCDGGLTPTAYDYLIGCGGQESENDYPYTGESGEPCSFNSADIVATISSYEFATHLFDETELQQSLLLTPISICVDAENWQDYIDGVMTWEECADISILDHCVQLVGYNMSDASNATNQYWIVRNSWGTDWGIDGYIWLQMWENTCGITELSTYPVI